MNVKRLFLLATLFVAVSARMAAQDGGRVALPFSRIDRSPRTSAFAGAGMASLTDVGAFQAFRGAAALPFQQGMFDAGIGIQMWEPSNEVDKTTNFQGGVALHIGSFGVALGGAYQSGVAAGKFTPSDRLVGLGLAYGIGKRFSLGVNARYAAQSLSKDITIKGFSADLTLLALITKELSATVGVSTLGTQVKGSDDTPYTQPSYALAALAWRHGFGESHAVEMVLDGEYNFDGSLAGALGAEYAFRSLLYVRAGYRLAGKTAILPSHLALGIGVHYSGFKADISFLTASALLKNTINFGIGYSF